MLSAAYSTLFNDCRKRKTAAGKVWGASISGVGLASMTFHASTGKWRSLGRKLDYWAIALSSGMLTRAIYPDLHPAVTAASIAATPFKPFFVSTINTLAMELKYLQRSFQDPKIRAAQRLHSASAIGGMALFTIEDSVLHIPLVHSAWHCMSATCVGTINALLKDAEDRFPENTLEADMEVQPLKA